MRRTSWHTRAERRLIRRFGGQPKRKLGTDGTLRGRPVEVRCQRKDRRFRIQRNVHQNLVRRNGSYIFASPGHRPKRVSARQVSRKLGRGKWYRDRTYPHKFLTRKDVFR